MSGAPRVRYAIYTRKSSDEGLEQSFNSLDAQREACATYILSQASEVWTEVQARYDDGGLWEAVQARLAAHVQGSRSGVRVASPSLLADKVVDEAGEPLVSTHACKGKIRYRYYVRRVLQLGTGDTGLRVRAREIETAVTERLASLFDDPVELSPRRGSPCPARTTTMPQRERRSLVASCRSGTEPWSTRYCGQRLTSV